MGLSAEVSAQMLDYALLGVSFAPPAAKYVALHAGNPEDGAPEVSPFRRQTDFIRENGSIHNNGRLEFADMPPTKAPISHYALYDAPNGGRRVFSEEFTGSSGNLRGGETVAIPHGGIVVV